MCTCMNPQCGLKMHSREVSSEEGDMKANEHDIMFIETSAKGGFNVKALFRKIATMLSKASDETESSRRGGKCSILRSRANRIRRE